MEQTKKTNDAELINEVMRAAGKLREHEVPTGWPEMLRTDEAIKLAYALEAAGYLNEDWQPGPKLYFQGSGSLNTPKASYVAQQFRDYLKKGQSYSPVFAQYWNAGISRQCAKQSKSISEIDAIVAELREENEVEKKAFDYVPERNCNADSKSYHVRANSLPDNAYEYMTRSVTVSTVQDFQEEVEDLILDIFKRDTRWNEFYHAIGDSAMTAMARSSFRDDARIIEVVVANVEDFLSDILERVAENIAWDLWETPILGDDAEE